MSKFTDCFPKWRDDCVKVDFWEPIITEGARRSDEWDGISDVMANGYREVIKKIGLAHIETIIQSSESPIETWLMTWTYFQFFMYYPFSMIVLNGGNSKAISNYIETRQMLAGIAGKDDDLLSTAKEVLTIEEFANYFVVDMFDIPDTVFVLPQADLSDSHPNLKRMRFDYLMFKMGQTDNPKPLIIECDGYEYHKASFIKDRKRDRAIRSSNLEIMRFSGSEIYEDPGKISLDLLNYWHQDHGKAGESA